MDDELSPQAAASATALSARWYVDAAMADIDRRAILDRSWQLIAHASQLRDAGDHVVADLGGLPVIAVRGADAGDAPGEIRVFHNVCRHRAGPIAQCDGLRAKSLRCRYHGWNYGLDGLLKSARTILASDEVVPLVKKPVISPKRSIAKSSSAPAV